MRRITMLALVAVVLLGGAACGGDDDSSGDEQTTDAATDDGAGDDSGDDGGDDGATDAAVAAGLLDEDCQFLLAGAYLNPLAGLASGADEEAIAESREQLAAIAGEAPDEIRDALETISDAFAEMADALEGVDMSDPQAFADPEVQAKLSDLEDVFDEDYEAAGQTVSDYIEENCTTR